MQISISFGSRVIRESCEKLKEVDTPAVHPVKNDDKITKTKSFIV